MYALIVFLPLIGFLIAGGFARALGDRGAMYATAGLVTLSAVLSWFVFFTFGGHDAGGEGDAHGAAQALVVTLAPWFHVGDLQVDWSIRIDALSAVMLVVVNSVSALVHWYSIGYMSHDPHKPRFFAYLSLFTFAMLMLVTANDFVQMFFGWEGVGLASYLLIGFWYKKPSANAAAMKAFIVNRIGDFGFALGVMGVFLAFGTVKFDDVFAAAPGMAEQSLSFLWLDANLMTTLCVLLFIGAMGKSAQFLLHTWLPDAMEGPTPVSALIHAATMVTAGVFMVCRLSPMFELSPTAMSVVAYFGATTAFFAATIGLVQNDIKRVVAYSTCSQLGYMFFAAGVGAYSAAMFHLFTHAFFKALLFLGSGSVIHAMHDEQDMRRMGGLKSAIPITYWMMVVGTLALTGFGIPGTLIGFAGFQSKDIIIESAFGAEGGAANFAFMMGVSAALMTSFYSWRLIFMTFHGECRSGPEALAAAHESPKVMLVPLYILAAGAGVAGMIWYGDFVGHHAAEFWNGALAAVNFEVLEAAHHVPFWVKISPFVVMATGFVIAYWMYIARPGMAAEVAKTHEPLYRFLLNKWYFDELYDFLFVRPAFFIGRFLWKRGDGGVIDRFGPDGLAAGVLALTRRASKLQTGYVYHYAFAMMIGVVFLISYSLSGGAH